MLLWQLRLTALETDPAAFLEKAEQHRAIPLSHYQERLRTGAPDHVVFGAFEGEDLVGMVGFGRDYDEPARRGRIWGMFVLPEYRGKGVGRSLLSAALDYATRLAGLETVQLAVARSQHAARSLYLSQGFENSGADGSECATMTFNLRGRARNFQA